MGTRRRRRASWEESMTWREARRLMRSKSVPPTTSSTTNSHPALSNPSPATPDPDADADSLRLARGPGRVVGMPAWSESVSADWRSA
eukprot:3005322-Rhodomonas_salina.1